MYFTIHPNYFLREGFGTLMSHYATMYSIYRDTGHNPIILDIDFHKKKLISAMSFFNNFNEPILYHQKVFPNLNSIFATVGEDILNNYSWKSLELYYLDYDKIINILKNQKDNFICSWTLNKDLINITYLDEILNFLYIFDDGIIKQCKNLMPNTSKTIVGICVRNEYKRLRYPHVNLSIDFYTNAMRQFDTNNTKFLIFSDDLEESKKMFTKLHQNFDIEYTLSMQSAIGMCLMSLCDHNICANSSFSFWASLLNRNKNKQIICSTKFIDDTKNKSLANQLNYKWYPDSWLALDIT